MNEELSLEELEQRILLLAIYKSKDDESFNDTINIMEQTKVFSVKVGKKYLKQLKQLN